MTDDSRSGTLVPAARNVKPMMTTGIWNSAPSALAHSTMGYVNKPIQMMDKKKVNQHSHSFPGGRQSGTVIANENERGSVTMNMTFALIGFSGSPSSDRPLMTAL